MLSLIEEKLTSVEGLDALKYAFEDILFSLENGDLVDLLQAANFLIEKYTDTPKKITPIAGMSCRE